jgi:hypothetical protein
MIIGPIILLVCTSFSGCFERGTTVEDEKDKFVGSWSTASIYDFLVLSPDGRLRKFRYEGTWRVDENKLILNYGAGSNSYDHTYYYSFTNYSLSNYTMVLINVDTGNSLTYTRQ